MFARENFEDLGRTCKASDFSPNLTVPCSKFIYDESIFEETLTTKLDLVCGNSYKIELLGTILMAGLYAKCKSI
jgi:hypothetical protein